MVSGLQTRDDADDDHDAAAQAMPPSLAYLRREGPGRFIEPALARPLSSRA
jgi:hypothetical protein